MTEQEHQKLIEFKELVTQMRIAQKAYFATRSQEALFVSKELEKAVDFRIKEFENPTLFG